MREWGDRSSECTLVMAGCSKASVDPRRARFVLLSTSLLFAGVFQVWLNQILMAWYSWFRITRLAEPAICIIPVLWRVLRLRRRSSLSGKGLCLLYWVWHLYEPTKSVSYWRWYQGPWLLAESSNFDLRVQNPFLALLCLLMHTCRLEVPFCLSLPSFVLHLCPPGIRCHCILLRESTGHRQTGMDR